MGYNRSKSKTSRRLKRTKTNKRNSARKQTFRKSTRVNRGGKGPQKRMQEDDGNYRDEKRNRVDYAPGSMAARMLQNKENNNNDPHNQAKTAHEKENDKQNELKRVANIEKDLYKAPTTAGVNVDPTEQLEITETQQNFNDDLDAETEGEEGDLEGGPITFAGKKKRATKNKATRRK